MKRKSLLARDLRAWAADEAFPPYCYYADVSPESRLAYRVAQLEHLAADPAHQAFAMGDPATGLVAAGITHLAWDSEQFGSPAGRVDYLIPALAPGRATLESRALLPARLRVAGRAVVEAASAAGLRHLSARIDARDVIAVQALEAAGFQVVDALLRFGVDVAGGVPPSDRRGDLHVRDAVPEDIPALRALATRAFVHDRFHNDPALAPGVADRLHAAWVENAVRGRTAAGVTIATMAGQLAGFFVLALDHDAEKHFGFPIGTLLLIGVDEAFRRRGVALALSHAGTAWLAARGARRVEVGTQLANLAAANLYTKAGFRLLQTSISLRWVPA
jgi:dTDP-4-amino-4,6-dideoxy-D-galactose acyltransferase